METSDTDELFTSMPQITVDHEQENVLNKPKSKTPTTEMSLSSEGKSELDSSIKLRKRSASVNEIIDIRRGVNTPRTSQSRHVRFPLVDIATPDSEVDKLVRNNPARIIRRASICLDVLSDECYYDLLTAIDEQIKETIQKSIYLHNQKHTLEKMILGESIMGLILNFFATIVTTSEIDVVTMHVLFYTIFFMGMLVSGLGLFIKWLNIRHVNQIENYRVTIREIITKYGADAHFLLEKYRLELPSDVLAAGFFRNIVDNKDDKK